MTDHSILRPALPDFPFQKEARLVTDILTGLFVRLPETFVRALHAQKSYDALYVMDSPGLAALGIDRDGIGRYALERAGVLKKTAQ